MASTKEYRDFILEQLSEAPNITCRPMMGEEIPYDGAKPMYFVEDIDDKEKLAEIVTNTVKGLR